MKYLKYYFNILFVPLSLTFSLILLSVQMFLILSLVQLSDQKQTLVFVLAGQSNMVGHAKVAMSKNALSPQIIVLSDNGNWEKAVDSNVELDRGPALFFAEKIHEETGKTIGLIQCAVDSSSIDQWNGPLFDSCLEKIKKANLGNDKKLAAMLFMQGESEAFNCELGWKEKFTGMVFKFRKELGFEFPVIFAQIADISTLCYRSIQEQQESITISGVRMIKSDDLWVGSDLHFNLEGYKVLGERFARSYLDINYGFFKKIIN